MNNLSIFVVISRTDTFVGKTVRKLFGGYYNHCGISLDDSFTKIYSFTRRYKQLWFTGCFCTETFDRFEDYIIYEIKVTEKEYNLIQRKINYYEEHFSIYNYVNAALILLGIALKVNKSCICSTFITSILKDLTTIQLDKDWRLYRPMEVKVLLDKQGIRRDDLWRK